MKLRIVTLILICLSQSLFGQKKLIDTEKSNDYTTYTFPVTKEKPENIIILSVDKVDWRNLEQLKSYKNVQMLRFNNCDISDFIIDFELFPQLQSIYTNECRFDTIVFNGNAINFKELYVYEKHLSNYNFLSSLNKLQGLYLSDQFSIDLDNLIANLTSLENLNTLYLSDGNISRLPISFAKIKRLDWLSLRYLDSTFDYDFNFNIIKDMEIVNLDLMFNYGNTVLTSEIKVLKNIKKLHIGNTGFGALPEEIGELTQLEELNMSMCEISDVPKSIVKLVNLKKLMLMPCKFTVIPDVLFEMVWLKELEVGGENWFPSKEELKPIRKKLKNTKVNTFFD